MHPCDIPYADRSSLSRERYYAIGDHIQFTLTTSDEYGISAEVSWWYITKGGTYWTAEIQAVAREGFV